MSEIRRCSRCGTEMPEGVEGLCPRCLLEAGLENKTSVSTSEPESRESDSASSTPHVESGSGATDAYRASFNPPTIEELAPRFPQLEILELLGRGGMGAVYKARQSALDRMVAVKILPPSLGRDRAFTDRFTREARALARLNHPHIVTVHDVGCTGDFCYFVMEYVDGVNLREALCTGQIDATKALAIVRQICDALEYAHEEGIVHRDIKPENILIDRRGRVKIADFGLAKLLHPMADEAGLTRTEQVMGTLRYMAPEQLQGTRAVDHRADIYSLGVVFYELLTGELPLGRFQPPSHKVQVDVRLDEIVLHALEQEPERRYQRAVEVKTAVERVESSPSRGQPSLAKLHARATRDGGGSSNSAQSSSIALRIAVFALCMLGINLLLLPWMRIRAIHSNTAVDEQYLYSDGTFDYRSGVFADIVAKGADLWQGIGTTIVCLAVMMTIMLSALVHHRGYRVGLMVAGGLIVFLGIWVIFDGSFPMKSRVQFAAAPDGLMKEQREQQGALSDVAFVEREAQERRVTLHRQVLPGIPAVMALGALLIAAGVAETVQARRATSKAAASDVAARGFRQSSVGIGAARADEPPRLAMLLVCAGGLVVGALVITAGLVVGVLAFFLEEPGTHAFWGWIGAAIGCIVGGGGSVAGTWNTYRQLVGAKDLLREPGWSWLDTAAAVYGGLGALSLLTAVPAYRGWSDVSGYAFALLGGMAVAQAAMYALCRAAVRER